MKKNKFVLITGACGYVGFQTSIFFLKKGYSVIGVDKNLNIKRKIFIHINTTNPILLGDSDERKIVEENNWEVSYDGMEINL